MRKILARTLSFIMCTIMATVPFSGTVMAAEQIAMDETVAIEENIDAEDNVIEPDFPDSLDSTGPTSDSPNAARAGTIYPSVGSTFVTVFTMSTNESGTITIHRPFYCRIDVRMYSGNTLVWSQNNAISGSSRTFNCGTNVTSVQIRALDSSGSPLLNAVTIQIDYDVSSPVI